MAKSLTLWDLKKKTPKKTPRKQTITAVNSPKKPKLVDLLEESRENAKLIDGARKMLSNAEGSAVHLGRENILLILVSRLGFSTTNYLMQCIRHVPMNFPRRREYVHDIMNSVAPCTFRDIDLAETCFMSRNVERVHQLPHNKEFQDLLWKSSVDKQTPYMCFLSPPVDSCLDCKSNLVERSVCKVTLYTMFGPFPGLKCSLRCTSCAITFELDRFHQDSCDSQFYDHPYRQDIVCASRRVYFTQDVFELLCELGNHAFVSAQAFAETYNSVFHNNHPNVRQFQMWQTQMATTKITGKELETEDYDGCDALIDGLDDRTEFSAVESTVTDGDMMSCCQVLMTRKNAMNAFLNGELLNELHERGMLDIIAVGKKFTRENAMQQIDILRRNELYPHNPEDCSSVCKERGCENLRVIDGCWKLCIPHCMMAVKVEVHGNPLLNFPNVCTAETAPNSVFCHDHLKLLKKHNIPTDKRAFLQHIGCKENPKSKEDIRQVDERILQVSDMLKNEDHNDAFASQSAMSYQGIGKLVQHIDPDLFELDTAEECNKDTGEKSRLRQRSRGVFVCASGGGNILCFNPLYKSESPSQVFMLVVNMIYQELKDVPASQLEQRLENYILSYDNMCHLDQLKAAKVDLPLPGPFKDMWHKIKKIIDRLHLSNHKNQQCKTKYNPDDILPPGSNTLATEQIFAWMSRYKKVVNSMTQTHHLFYLHRMCKRRNRYTGQCRQRGREPLLPGINYNISNTSSNT